MLCQLSYASRRATAGDYETAARERHRFSYTTRPLEREGDAASDRTVSLCEKQRAAVGGHKGTIPLCKQVAHIKYRLRIPRQDAPDSDRLAQQNAEIGVAISRSIRIDRRDGVLRLPAIGGTPVRSQATEISLRCNGDGLRPLGPQRTDHLVDGLVLLRFLPRRRILKRRACCHLGGDSETLEHRIDSGNGEPIRSVAGRCRSKDAGDRIYKETAGCT